MKIYLLYKYTTDIEKSFIDSAWDSENGAKKRGSFLMENKYHVFIEPMELRNEEKEKTSKEIAKESFGSNFKPQTEPYTEYDYHYSPCEEYGDFDDPYRMNSKHPFWDY
jgi:hypothetical protein